MAVISALWGFVVTLASAQTCTYTGDSTNPRPIVKWMSEQGINDEYALAVILGNLWRESLLNPKACESYGGPASDLNTCPRTWSGSYEVTGVGLLQWSYDRREDLFAYCKAKKLDVNLATSQLQFMATEADWPRALACFKQKGLAFGSIWDNAGATAGTYWSCAAKWTRWGVAGDRDAQAKVYLPFISCGSSAPAVPTAPSGKVDMVMPHKAQMDNYYEKCCSCGMTSATMVLNYLGGLNTDVDDNWEAYGKLAGQSPEGVASIFEAKGFTAKFSYKGTKAELKAHLDAGRPLVVNSFLTDGHVIVFRGYDDKGWFVNDPAGHRFNGGYFSRSGAGAHYTHAQVQDCGRGCWMNDGDIWYATIMNGNAVPPVKNSVPCGVGGTCQASCASGFSAVASANCKAAATSKCCVRDALPVPCGNGGMCAASCGTKESQVASVTCKGSTPKCCKKNPAPVPCGRGGLCTVGNCAAGFSVAASANCAGTTKCCTPTPTQPPTADAQQICPLDAGSTAPDKQSKWDSVFKMCATSVDVYGPFTQAMVNKCVLNGGGTACSNTFSVTVSSKQVSLMRWGRAFAQNIRGSATCPLGSTPQAAYDNHCVEGQDVYGPFETVLVAECNRRGGGLACLTPRWGRDFYTYLRNNVQNLVAAASVEATPVACAKLLCAQVTDITPNNCTEVDAEILASPTAISVYLADGQCSTCRGRCCTQNVLLGKLCGNGPFNATGCTDSDADTQRAEVSWSENTTGTPASPASSSNCLKALHIVAGFQFVHFFAF